MNVSYSETNDNNVDNDNVSMYCILQMCKDKSYSESARTPCCAYCISDSTCSNSLRSCCTWRLRAATSCRRTSGSCLEHMLDATEFTEQCPHCYNHPSISQLCQSISQLPIKSQPSIDHGSLKINITAANQCHRNQLITEDNQYHNFTANQCHRANQRPCCQLVSQLPVNHRGQSITDANQCHSCQSI